MHKICFFASMLLLCGSCQKYYISISQDRITRDFLASTQAKTPDPRQKNPPLGERLVVEWQLPRDLLEQDPILRLHVIYKNYTEDFFEYPISHRIDYVVCKLLNKEYEEKKGILTYEAQVVTKDGSIFRDWKHQLFAKLITLPQDEEDSIELK
jgi:hypothetical protein